MPYITDLTPTLASDMVQIYGLVDPTTQLVRYVGKSKDLTQRLKGHLRDHRKCHRVDWLRSLTNQGLQPEIVILENVNHINWQKAERRWIALFREFGIPLTNCTDGGDGLDNPSEETRKKIAKGQLGRIHSEERRKKNGDVHRGLPPTFKGCKHSKETRSKISVARLKHPSDGFKGHKHSGFARLKMSVAKTGEYPSIETRKKLSDAQTGHIVSEETRLKISTATMGRQTRLGQSPSEDTRHKLSEALKGRIFSNETLRKMSLAGKIRWQLKKEQEAQCRILQT